MTKSADKELLRASFKLEYPYERSPGPIIGKFFEELSNEVLVGTKNSKGEIFGSILFIIFLSVAVLKEIAILFAG